MIALKDQIPCVGWQSNKTMIEKFDWLKVVYL